MSATPECEHDDSRQCPLCLHVKQCKHLTDRTWTTSTVSVDVVRLDDAVTSMPEQIELVLCPFCAGDLFARLMGYTRERKE